VRRAAIVLCAVALAASGCGKPGDYTASKSRSCLVDKGRVSDPRDFVASTATGGAFVVTLPDNDVTVAFGQNVEDANAINEAYRRFRGENIGIDDVLRQQRNAVLLWHQHPSDGDVALVQSCLK
jgi:hypothetical protein